MNGKKNSVISLLDCLFAAITIVLNITCFFVLPDRIITQINFDGSTPQTVNKAVYLIAAMLIIGLSSMLSIKFEEKRIKYFVIVCVLTVGNLLAVVYNLCV